MQTVNFPCDHCGNLIAVVQESLGQQVRCPHCQQVLRAPTGPAEGAAETPAEPAGEAPAEPIFAIPAPGEQESIFAPPEEAGDDLFGAPAAPRLELPEGPEGWIKPSTDWPAAPNLAPAPEVDADSPRPPQFSPLEFSEPPEPSSSLPSTQSPERPADEAAPFAPPPSGEGIAGIQSASDLTGGTLVGAGPPFAYARRSGWVIALLIVPLISYSILATIAVLILYFRPQPPHPLEMLPDIGQNPGAIRTKSSLIYERFPPELPLPARLRVALGQSLRVGNLEVTPQKVELRKLSYRVEGFARAEESNEPALVLQVHLRNVSEDVAFHPTDPYFDRRSRPQQSNRPYTYLAIGNRRFYGGPLEWKPSRGDATGRFSEPRQWIEGQDYETRLQPGEEMTTLICTAPDEEIAEALLEHPGPLLWRVQFRRGLVRVRDRELSATAVVGVEFSRRDIRQEG